MGDERNGGSRDVTELLARAEGGNRAAADELMAAVYDELRRMAHGRMIGERAGHTLQTTALVHEAWMRLVGDRGESGRWENRAHFFGAAAQAMRRILVDQARSRQRIKRGSGEQPVGLSRVEPGVAPPDEEILALDVALTELEAQDESMGAVVKLRYFAGLTVEETAEVLGTSPRSINRLWVGARAWLRRRMQG